MAKLTLKDIVINDKRVLVRVDFNVPLSKGGEITDDSRIRAAIPTIKYLTEQGSKVILMSHLGRPDGKVVEALRLNIVAKRLSQLLGQPVGMAKGCIGPDIEQAVAAMKSGDILFLENIRFHAEEEAGNPEFAQALARLGDVFVNDAFGTAHRPHASVSGIAQYLPAVAGFLMEKEIEFLSRVTDSPIHPFAALIGGAKISDKMQMLENMSRKVDYMLIGGGMAATFLKARGYEVGKSMIELDRLKMTVALINNVKQNGVRLMLPVDVIVADEKDAHNKTEMVSIQGVTRNKKIVDIGPETVRNFTNVLKKCKTVFRNGPMGIYEIQQFASGTQAVAGILAELKATTIIGGGSTADVVTDLKLAEKMTFVSTGGGASLSFVSGEKLPGIEALLDKKN